MVFLCKNSNQGCKISIIKMILTVCCLLGIFFSLVSADIKCRVGEVLYHPELCNDCFCGREDKWICAPENCHGGLHKKYRHNVDSINIFDCKQGPILPRGDDCNWCFCRADGLVQYCTDKFCQPDDSQDQTYGFLGG